MTRMERNTMVLLISGLLVLCIMVVTAAFSGETVPPKAFAKASVLPENADEQCQYVSTPWGGSRCEIGPDQCSMIFAPMFFDDNRVVYFKLDTSETKIDVEESIDFATVDGSSIEVKHEWEGLTIKWVEWYVRSPGETYAPIPIQGCYCNERDRVIYICRNGRMAEVVGIE